MEYLRAKFKVPSANLDMQGEISATYYDTNRTYPQIVVPSFCMKYYLKYLLR